MIDGRLLSNNENGLTITSNGNVIRGLQIINFPNDGIEIQNAADNIIGGDSTIGAGPNGRGNIITGNGVDGIDLWGSNSLNNSIQGNLIGLDADGTRDFRVPVLRISPDFIQDQTLFAGTQRDGIWRSTDAGVVWEQINEGLHVHTIYDIAISPNFASDQTMFAATLYGGIFRSIDAGTTWTRIDGRSANDRKVVSLAISPNYGSDQTIFAAVTGVGLLRSQDGGTNWTLLEDIIGDQRWFLHGVTISPNYQVDQTLFVFTDRRIYKSTNRGNTWSLVRDQMINIQNVVLSPNYASDDTALASIDDCTGEADIWKTTDGGSTWDSLAQSVNFCGIRSVAFSPNYATDAVIFVGSNWGGVYRSTDAGLNWTMVLEEHFNWSIAFSPAYDLDQTLFVSQNTGGMQKSTDRGLTWQAVGVGLTEFGNGTDGIRVRDGAQYTQIGGTSAGQRNIISNNGERGVSFNNAHHNHLLLNYIGTDEAGLTALGNDTEGVIIEGGSTYNDVEQNLISGNVLAGIGLRNAGTMTNTLLGNYIGVDVIGTGTIWNGQSGIVLSDGAQYTRVGVPGQGNIIGGNLEQGVSIWDAGTNNNVIVGNYIGIGADGTTAIGNYNDGILIGTGSINTRIGGPSSEDRNIISANLGNGIGIGGDSSGHIISGNYIGTDVAGSFPMGNQETGIALSDGAHDIQIGGTGPGEGNLVSGNKSTGINMWGVGAFNNVVSGNLIGTDISGFRALGNQGNGLGFFAGTHNNQIGPGNHIAYNQFNGVLVSDSGTGQITITQNSIHNNGTSPIDNYNGGNLNLSPPFINQVTETNVTGLTSSGFMVVEIYSDQGEEGRVYEGQTMSDAAGQFSFSPPVNFHGPYITAVTQDAAGNTSTFSLPEALAQIPACMLESTYESLKSQAYTEHPDDEIARITLLINLLDTEWEAASGQIGQAWTATPSNATIINFGHRSIIWTNTFGYAPNAAPVGLWYPDKDAVSGYWGVFNASGSMELFSSGRSARLCSSANSGGPTSVNITGNTVGEAGTAYTFAAQTQPVTVTLPLTYTWQAGEQEPIQHVRTSLSDSVQFTWTEPGTKVLTATVSNASGVVTDTHLINLVSQNSSTNWTVMVYLNGDNNLDPSMDDAFNRLESVANNPDVQIAVLWDRNPNTGGDWDPGSFYYEVQYDTNPLALADYTENVNRWEHGELNLGDDLTLYQFVSWARLKYPAEHYMLIMTDHGGGWSPELPNGLPRRGGWALGGTGLSWDETGNNDGPDFLSTHEMGKVMRTLTSDGLNPLDIVFYDACLMGIFEEIYEVRDYASYMIASENIAWNIFAYDAYISTIGPETQPPELASEIVTLYDAALLPGYAGTIAAYDLSQTNTVANSLRQLGQRLLEQEGNGVTRQQILAAYLAAQKMDYDSSGDIVQDREGYVDLYDFAQHVAELVTNTDIVAAADSFLTVFEQSGFILAEAHRSGQWNLADAHGVSIYVPFGEELYIGNECTNINLDPCSLNDDPYCLKLRNFYTTTVPPQTVQLTFAQETNWDEFVNGFVDAQFCSVTTGGLLDRPVSILNEPRDGNFLTGGTNVKYIYLPLALR